MNIETMQRIGTEIASQDNRATDCPIFIVQERKRIWGVDSNYFDDYEWLREDDHECTANRIERAGLDSLSEEGEDVDGWEKVHYLDIWEFVAACFTEQGCKDFIAVNGHNLNEPRIYAAGSYRNEEFRAVQGYLKGLAAVEASHE